MIEIFKTNISDKKTTSKIIKLLKISFPNAVINFDLEDCDKILRVKNEDNFNSILIIKIVEEAGFICQILTD